MHQASIGAHCPTCVRSFSRKHKPIAAATKVALQGHEPYATTAIIALCVLVFVWDIVSGGASGTSGGSVANQLALNALPVRFEGEWWRVVTTSLAHSGLIHIGFNMWLLWVLGRTLESSFGTLTFAAMYVSGVLGGSLGALLIEPTSTVVGASGGVFALMGITVVLQRMGGLNVFESGLGGLILINVMLSFRGGVSLGGHLGGLAVGLIIGAIVGEARRRGIKALAAVPVAVALVGLIVMFALIPAVDRAVARFGF